jgi:outer membrane protein
LSPRPKGFIFLYHFNQPAGFPVYEVHTMNSLYRKLLTTLLVCALPAMAVATDNTPGKDQTVPTPVQATPQSTPAPVQKAPEVASPQQPLPAPTAATPPKSGETSAAQPAIRIGYIDLIRIGTESEPGKAGQAQLTERQKKFKSQLDAKRKQLDKQRSAIEAKLSALSPQQREAKGKEFGKKVEEFQKFGQGAEEQLQELQQAVSRSLFEKVEQVAADYGKTSGLTAIIVKRELLYAASGVDVRDVTDQVIKLLDEKGQEK